MSRDTTVPEPVPSGPSDRLRGPDPALEAYIAKPAPPASGETFQKLWRRSLSAVRVYAPGLVVLAALPVVVMAAWRATFAILGRDQGIYQYVAWALMHGQTAYLDFREINGPLPHFIHLVFMLLGGGDEHIFRTLDIALSSAVFLLVGFLLAGTMQKSRVLASGHDAVVKRPPIAERLIWSGASLVVFMSAYLSYGWWQTAQRESFYNLFLLLSLAIQVQASTPFSDSTPRRRDLYLGIAGFLSMLPSFGKPTCLLYTAGQAAVLFLVPPAGLSRREAFWSFVGGSQVGATVMWYLSSSFGALGNAVELIFYETPRLYRYVWKRSLWEAVNIWGNRPRVFLSVAAMLAALVAIFTKRLPRRALALVVLPAVGLAVFLLQGKGFPYHLHPVTAGAGLLGLILLAGLVERADQSPEGDKTRRVALGVAAVFGLSMHFWARDSEAFKERWDLAGPTPEARKSQAYFEKFPWGDFFAWDLREAAAYLQAHTAPDDTVQVYGMDPYLLYLAKRKTATPYIYSFELNIEASLEGGSGGRPDEEEESWLRSRQRKHEGEMLAALKAHPPAAFALIDRAPFVYSPNSEEDLAKSCPRVFGWMQEHYALATQTGNVRIFLRRPVDSLKTSRN